MSERPSITYEGRYIGAEITEWVFITFAVLWFFSGLITIVLTAHHRYVTGTGLSMTLLIAIEVIATLLGTAMFAFFGFVLDLLRGIWEETAGEND
jgi:formate-dependent nitrite reductase membrane component NrfD